MTISLEKVSRTFDETNIQYPDWEVAGADHALILGNSGSGKTTLLHLITGLLRPSSGKILLAERDISKLSNKELDRFRGEEVGIVFQKPHLIRSLTVGENIRMGLKFGKKSASKGRLEEVTSMLGISSLLNRKAYELSEGQAQRVSIARAVIHGPRLLAADEPTASLDDENCDRVVELLKKEAELCEATLIIATHDQRVKGQFEKHLQL